ncbi:DUF2169 domain-containing protein [Myxococcota bacterium]|nr:DUF2169 domain-containing protein [Myxococcota bacterium]
MWALDNRTPYAAERTWVRDRDGAHQWIVVVKGTWLIADDGALTLADEQLPPLYAAEYNGEPGRSSIRYEADLLGMKPGTDVTLLGSAHAPGGRAATSVEVGLQVGPINKRLMVFGPRVYERGLVGVSPGPAEPFLAQPIRWELAWGGTDDRDPDPSQHSQEPLNPVGRGRCADRAALLGTPAHQLEPLDGTQAPIGLGPIGPHWSPRLGFAGTYDDPWFARRRPLLPEDFDARFFMCAPPDQQVIGHLHGGEPVELRHLHPVPKLRFGLPKHWFVFSSRLGRRDIEHRARLVSVVIEPDERRLQVVWQTSLAVAAHEVDYLDKTILKEKAYL